MKLTKHGWSRSVIETIAPVVLLAVLALCGPGAEAQAVSTTTVQGTVYLANGLTGAGSLDVSWPAFTTAASQAVAAGRISVKIGADGGVSVSLAPNVGATPAGLFYTAVYHLSDGTTSTEYWVVPATPTAALSAVRAQVMPAAQAIQAASKAYVDQAIASVSGSQLTGGGTLTGALTLAGDPTQPLQAADKQYVDAQVATALPLTGGTVSGAFTAKQIGGAVQADQFAGADFGAKVQACVNALSPAYGGTCDARNFTGTLAMASNLTIATSNTTILLPCATIATANQVTVTAGTRNVSLRGCALRGGSAADGGKGGTAFLYTGAGAAIQVGDSTYAMDTPGFHLDNVVINTTGATAATAQGFAAYRMQELDLESAYLLGNSNQTGMTLDGTGNYTGGTFFDNHVSGFGVAVNGIGHQITNAATTDWLNASTFVRLHINCPTSGGIPISGTIGINLQAGDGNTFTGGDVEGCATALHLGANAVNNTIVGLRNENSTSQVVADAGSAYNSWMSGGTMFTGELTDNGTRNSFLDTFHRSFNGLNGDWYGSQQDATVTNHYRLGIGAGNERGLLDRFQSDYGYRWTMGLSDATAGEQFYQIKDELNNVNRVSIGQYNAGQSSTNNQTVINSAGTGAVVLNGSANSGTGGLVIGAGGATGATVATVNSAGNAQLNGTLQVGGTTTFGGSTTVRNQADAEIDQFLWAGATANQKESFIYKDYSGASQWYMVKDASNNWALNSATGGLDSLKAYQSTNSGDTYVNASNSTGVVRVNYESGSGAAFKVYGGGSSSLYASFTGTNAIQFPGLAATSGRYCLQIDNSGYVTNTGSACGSSAGGNGTVSSGGSGQIAYYTADGTTVGGESTVPISAGGTGAATAAAALTNLGALPLSGGTLTGNITAQQATATAITASVNTVISVTAPPYSAKCDGTTDDQAAIQAAFNAALTSGSSVQFPAGTCLTSTIVWKGQSFFGAGMSLSVVKGKPGQDVFQTPDSAWGPPINTHVHDIMVMVDSTVDASAVGTNAFPNRIFGTAGGWSMGSYYGATGCTASISASSNTLTVTGSSPYCPDFTSKNYTWAGAPITVKGAGASGADLITTIAAVTSSTQATLSSAATTSVSAGSANITLLLNPPIAAGNFAFTASNCAGATATAGSATVTVPCAKFTTPQIGQPFTFSGAGVGGADLVTTIASVVSTTQVTLAAAASTTVANGSGNFWNPVTPPWYCGNAGFALPMSDGKVAATTAGDAWVFENVEVISGAAQGQWTHTCGIFAQMQPYGWILNNVTTRTLYGGYIEALPVTNVGSVVWTPDQSYFNEYISALNVIPFVGYNGEHRVLSLNIYGLSYSNPDTGAWFLNAPTGFMTNNPTYSGSATITHIYDECNNLMSGEQARFQGIFTILGGVSCAGKQTYIKWLAHDSVVNALLSSSLVIGDPNVTTAGRNVFTSTALPYGYVTDYTLTSKVQSGKLASSAAAMRDFSADPIPPQDPVGKMDGSFLLAGASGTPFLNASDLVTSCKDYPSFGPTASNNTSCVADPTGSEFTRSYIHDVNGSVSFGMGSAVGTYPSWAVGQRFMQGKHYVIAQGRCVGSSACGATVTFTDATAATTIGSCTWGFGTTWTLNGSPSGANPCTLDLSSVPAGDVIMWNTGTWSGSPTAKDIAFVAFEPFNTDILSQVMVYASPTVNVLPKATGGSSTGALTNSSITDNGTTVSTTEPLAASSFSGAGTGLTGSAPSLTAGNATLAATATHAQNLPADLATQSASSPAAATHTVVTETTLPSAALIGTSSSGQHQAVTLGAGLSVSGTTLSNSLPLVQSVPAWLQFMGDGSGGAYTCSSTTCTSNGDTWLSSLTVNSGAILSLISGSHDGMWTLHVTGACTIAGTISGSVNSGSFTGVLNPGMWGAGGGGGGGGTAAGVAGYASTMGTTGGTAGAAGGGSGGAGGTQMSSTVSYKQMLLAYGPGIQPFTSGSTWYDFGGAKGGTGGSSGAAGGNGGSGLVLVCGSINFTGTIDVSGAAGGASTANNLGAGGGGGGGFVIMRSPNWIANTGTINVSGGAGGSCGSYTGCGAGGAGGAGWYKQFTN